MLRNLSIMCFSKNPNPSEWFTNSIHFFQSVCLCELSTAVCTACQESDPRRALWALQYMDCPEPASQSCSARREKSDPQVSRSLNCRCQGLISISSAVPASTPQNRRQLFKGIIGNCCAVQEQEEQDVNQQHLRSSK